jgi:hypothetical protein
VTLSRVSHPETVRRLEAPCTARCPINAVIGEVESDQIHLSGNATNQDLALSGGRACFNRYSSCNRGNRMAIKTATRSGCWYLDIVDATVPPPSRCSTTVLVG